MTTSPDEHDTPWIKAMASGSSGGNCVEMRRHGGRIEVRNSKSPAGPTLRLPSSAWSAWLERAKNGELDHLLAQD